MVILIGCLSLICFLTREPAYHGKTLTEWIYSLEGRNWPTYVPFDDERLKAIKHFGSNAVPRLLEFIAARDGPLKTKISSFLNRQTLVRCHIHTADEKRRCACTVFENIGPHPLIAAVPGLIQLTKHKEPKIREIALRCLSTIHTDKDTFLPVLTDRLRDPDKNISSHAASLLQRRFPDDAEQAGLYQVFPGMKPQVVEIRTPASRRAD